MAKMTEADAANLLLVAAQLAATVSALIPTLVDNFNAIREGLGGADPDALNAKIVTTHGEIQALDARLQALRS